ncbi:hypothetical protein Agub_g3378, partial [Astrephomene gubernaculifera]
MMPSSSSWLGRLQPWHVVMLAGLVRAGLICWAEYQDRYLSVKYTDIDYVVFTDAARFVAKGDSPYRRSTYRYSPLLAYLMLPNIWLHPAFGKVLFSAADLVAAALMSYILRRTAASPSLRTLALLAWLFNPYTATISTRGSCDVLSVLLLLSLLVCLLQGRTLAAGALYGLAVHFRIYPVIYGPAIMMFLARRALALQGGRQEDNLQGRSHLGEQQGGGRQQQQLLLSRSGLGGSGTTSAQSSPNKGCKGSGTAAKGLGTGGEQSNRGSRSNSSSPNVRWDSAAAAAAATGAAATASPSRPEEDEG